MGILLIITKYSNNLTVQFARHLLIALSSDDCRRNIFRCSVSFPFTYYTYFFVNRTSILTNISSFTFNLLFFFKVRSKLCEHYINMRHRAQMNSRSTKASCFMFTRRTWSQIGGGRNAEIERVWYPPIMEQTEEIELPMHDAARRGNLLMLREYIKEGVSGTGLDAMGNTALYWAAHAGHLDCVKELLNVPHSVVNVQNKLGETPLHVAACRGHADVVNLLLQNGTDTAIKNNDGLVAEQLSSELSIKNAIQLSRRHDSRTSGYVDDDYNDDSD